MRRRRFALGWVAFEGGSAAEGAGTGGCAGGGGCSSITTSWVIWLTLAVATTMAAQLASAASTDGADGKVCQSIDARNTAESLKDLRGCRVVEGFVHILLIDDGDENSFANYSFPELIEITDYLLVYRVAWLRSLSNLFPNLKVIRGNRLIHNYALAIYENNHLQDVGLISLSHISRGAVRIERNPNLCFTDTVDWDAVAVRGLGENFLENNSPSRICPPCPDECAKYSSSKLKHCWTAQDCQITCTDKNSLNACYKLNNGSYAGCNELCLSCEGPDSCDLCIIDFNGRCLQRCPKETFNYLGRRCIGAEECRLMPPPKSLSSLQKTPWIAFQGECRLKCPPNYTEGNGTCEPCKGLCRKECEGASVSSIATAQKLRGCTYILGALEIQVRGGKNIVKELEENLNSIEEIVGYLKIVRSFPLISLNFLRSLKVIHGKILESNRYSLIVLDNQNLEELWDWENKKLDIRNGTIFFHFNPKLCYEKIEKLIQVAKIDQPNENDVAPNSNGDKIACNVTELEVSIDRLRDVVAVVRWKPFKHHDDRSLLGYVVYSIEAPEQNLTWYDSRDACGGDGWRVDDVSPNNRSDSYNNSSEADDDKKNTYEIYHILTFLKPYTQYGYYVKTYTIASERRGAQSKIKYFRTWPGDPSQPVNLRAESNSSISLIIEWSPPLSPNGNVTSYSITGYIHQNDLDTKNDIDYCKTALPLDNLPNLPQPISTPTPNLQPSKCSCSGSEKTCSCEASTEKPKDSDCNCDKISTTTLDKDHDRQVQIQFENDIQNLVFIKRQNPLIDPPYDNRRRRHVDGHSDEPHSVDFFAASHRYKRDFQEPRTSETYVLPENFTTTVRGQNKAVITGLKHFTFYVINVRACREREKTDGVNVTLCSKNAMITVRTLPLEGADVIQMGTPVVEEPNVTLAGSSASSSSFHNLGRIRLSWTPPEKPNGAVLTYEIQYRRVDIENHKPQTECVTNKAFTEHNQSYTLNNLTPGNYSITIHAVSRWGRGPDTDPIYVFVPERPHNSIELVVGVIVGLFIVIGIIIGCIIYIRRKYAPGVPNMKLIASVNPEYMSTAYVPDEWELPRNKVELLCELGQGSFGMVYEGVVRDLPDCRPGISPIRCAVKTVNVNATDRERSEFLNEASVMKAFNTHHVVRLLGVVSQGHPVLVVMELMARGDLKTFLRSHRPDEATSSSTASGSPVVQPPSLFRFLQMAAEIADGMAYLAAKKFVHRDLAARNCMVAEDLTVKIGDFGMTRDIYETDYYRKGTKGLLPVRWMAPESLKDGVFTSCSDVWSYGVVLWEMATLASQPYQGLSNDQVLRYVIDGGVMERPAGCPERFFDLMLQCWQHKPSARPQFLDILDSLLSRGEVTFPAGRSFYHSPEGIEHRQQAALRDAVYAAQMDDDPSTPLRLTRDVEDFSVDEGGGDLDDGGSASDLDGDPLRDRVHGNPKMNPTSAATSLMNGEYEAMNGNGGNSSNGINSPSSDVSSLHRHHHHPPHHSIRHLHNSPPDGPAAAVTTSAPSTQPNGHWPPLKTTQC